MGTTMTRTRNCVRANVATASATTITMSFRGRGETAARYTASTAQVNAGYATTSVMSIDDSGIQGIQTLNDATRYDSRLLPVTSRASRNVGRHTELMTNAFRTWASCSAGGTSRS